MIIFYWKKNIVRPNILIKNSEFCIHGNETVNHKPNRVFTYLITLEYGVSESDTGVHAL